MGFTTQSDTFRGYQEKPPYILSGDFGLRKFIIFFGKTTEQLPLGSQKLQIINEMQTFGKFYEEDSPESDHFRLASFPYDFKSTKKYWHGQPLGNAKIFKNFSQTVYLAAAALDRRLLCLCWLRRAYSS